MTKEEKEIFLKDLLPRIPYHVKVLCPDGENTELFFEDSTIWICYENGLICSLDWYLQDLKPYLRPMSSMTEEEKKQLVELLDCDSVNEDGVLFSEGGTLDDYLSCVSFKAASLIVNWLNKHHFDYNGLIKRGLVLKAPEEMYTKGGAE